MGALFYLPQGVYERTAFFIIHLVGFLDQVITPKLYADFNYGLPFIMKISINSCISKLILKMNLSFLLYFQIF